MQTICKNQPNFNSILGVLPVKQGDVSFGRLPIDANGVKEERSVLFIRTLLLGRTKNNIDIGTTQSNIDGYIELLDSSNRISGKMTVQVKTVSKR